uniref:7TM GPCR serpentine receptor class x (Srx) domain-containing protein n=1 Tax=Strongyloides venezuelensis TaxID=75913 RepID=A0A0K0F1P6_STRVS
MSRVINFLFIKSSVLENVANSFIYWIIDLEIFGLFYAVLFLSSPLRNLILLNKNFYASGNSVMVVVVTRNKNINGS